jgi:hypothetical protein
MLNVPYIGPMMLTFGFSSALRAFALLGTLAFFLPNSVPQPLQGAVSALPLVFVDRARQEPLQIRALPA